MWRIVGDNPLSALIAAPRSSARWSRRRSGSKPRCPSSARCSPRWPERHAIPALARRPMCALYLGLIVMHLWRACGSVGEGDSARRGRARRRSASASSSRCITATSSSVDEYCRMLSVTRAHLHSACVRALGRSPQRLVHDRLAAEARLRLRQSALPVEQVAYSLGFRDPAYFNRFFRRLTGVSPGAYRKAARVAPPPESTSFEAWP